MSKLWFLLLMLLCIIPFSFAGILSDQYYILPTTVNNFTIIGANITTYIYGNISNVSNNGDGTYTWHFSNGQNFTTGNLTGPIGPVGPQGPQGIQGVAGINGSNGVNGSSINLTAIIFSGGNISLNWSNGQFFFGPNLTGPQGVQGFNGSQGIQGIPGVNGSNAFNVTYNITNNVSVQYNASGVSPYLFGLNNISFNDTYGNQTVLSLCSRFNDSSYVDSQILLVNGRISSVNSSLQSLILTESANNVTQASLISGLTSKQSADNVTIALQLNALRADNTTQAGLISALTSTESANNITQSGLLNLKYNSSNPNAFQNDTQVNTLIMAALNTTTFLPNSSQLVSGNALYGNNIGNLSFIDYNDYNASNNFDIRVNFTNVSSFNDVSVKMSYSSNNNAHYVVIALWDYTNNGWQGYTAIPPDGIVYETYDIPIDDFQNHLNLSLSGGLVQLRIYMASGAAAGDTISVDRSVLLKGLNIPSSTATNPVVSFLTVGSGSDSQGLNLTRFDGVSFVSYLDYSFKFNRSEFTEPNVRGLGFMNSSQLVNTFTNKSANEQITGNWYFNPNINSTFTGTEYHYGLAYFLGFVTITNQAFLNVSSSGILINNIANQTIGYWRDNGGLSILWNNGIINSTGNIFTAGSFIDSGIDVLTQANADNVTQSGLISSLTTIESANNVTQSGLISALTSKQSADNATIALQLNALRADNTTQAGLISALTSTESANNITQSGLIATLRADNTTQAGLISALSSQQSSDNSTLAGQILLRYLSSNPAGFYNVTTLVVPYQSSAAGWINNSIISTNKNVSINSTLNVTFSLFASNIFESGVDLSAQEVNDNSTQAGLISSLTTKQSNDNATIAIQLNALRADNTTQAGLISTLSSRQSSDNATIALQLNTLRADNTTQAGLISSVTSTESANNATQATLISTAQTTANNALPKSGGSMTGNVSFGSGTNVLLGGNLPRYVWYYNSTYWDCLNATGTIYNRGNSSVTCT